MCERGVGVLLGYMLNWILCGLCWSTNWRSSYVLLFGGPCVLLPHDSSRGDKADEAARLRRLCQDEEGKGRREGGKKSAAIYAARKWIRGGCMDEDIADAVQLNREKQRSISDGSIHSSKPHKFP